MPTRRGIQVYEGEAHWPDGQDGLVNIKMMVLFEKDGENYHEYVDMLASEDEVAIFTPDSPFYFAGEDDMIVYRFDTDQTYRAMNVTPNHTDLSDFICYDGLVLIEEDEL